MVPSAGCTVVVMEAGRIVEEFEGTHISLLARGTICAMLVGSRQEML